MPDPPVRRFAGRDGLDLAYRELGNGRPLVLLHGFTGDGRQWIDPGPAALLARNGFRVILPDLPKGVPAKSFGVTIEDSGGAQTPTMPIIMAGS